LQAWDGSAVNWKVPDIFKGNNESVYWYTNGFNLRAFAAWIGIVWLSLPGFAVAVTSHSIGVAWKRIFQITFFIGMVGGFVFYLCLCYLCSPKDATVHQDYDWIVERADLLEGKELEIGDVGDDVDLEGKGSTQREKTAAANSIA
jgi:NCS1 family nucleobase:cation symporter-1